MEQDSQLLPDELRRRLIDRRPELIQNIDLKKNVLLDRLRQEEVLTEEQMFDIQRIHENERIDELVSILLRSSLGTYRKFRQCLIDAEQEHVVREILDKDGRRVNYKILWVFAFTTLVAAIVTGIHLNNEYTKKQALLAREAIAERFLEKYSRLPHWSSDEAWPVLLDDIYTEMTWMNVTRKPTTVEKHPLASYHSLLMKDGHRPLYVLVTGKNGIGKTAFAIYLAYTWARDVTDPDYADESTRAIMEQFDYLLPLRLRDLRQNHNFTSFIKQQFQFLDESLLGALIDAITTSPQRILCIFDGYNEITGRSPDVLDIMERNTMSYRLNIIITSKEYAAREIREHLGLTGREVLITGYNETQMELYIHKCHPGDAQRKQELVKKIKSSRSLSEFCHNPLYLHLFCSLSTLSVADLGHLPTLYLESLMVTLRRYNREIKKDKRRLSTEIMLDLYKEPLKRLGRLAYKDCDGNSFRQTFSVHCVEESVGEDALKFGILVTIPPENPSRKLTVEFYHETFQAFMIALGIHLGNDDLINTLHNDSVRSKLGFLSMQFLGGLNPTKSNKMVKLTADFVLVAMERNGLSKVIQSHMHLLAVFDFTNGHFLPAYRSVKDANMHLTYVYLSPFIFIEESHKNAIYDYLELGYPIIYDKVRMLLVDLSVRHSKVLPQKGVVEDWDNRLKRILPLALKAPLLEHLYLWPADKAYVIIKQMKEYLPSTFTFSYACDDNSTGTEAPGNLQKNALRDVIIQNPPDFGKLVELHIDGPSEKKVPFRISALFPQIREIKLDLGFCVEEYKRLAKGLDEMITPVKWRRIKWTIPVDLFIFELQIEVLERLMSLKYLDLVFVFLDESDQSLDLGRSHAEKIRRLFPHIKIYTDTFLLRQHSRYLRPTNKTVYADIEEYILQ